MNNNRDPVIGDWCGNEVYKCPECAFDTMDSPNFDNHMATAHPLPGTPVHDDPVIESAPDEPVEPVVEIEVIAPEKSATKEVVTDG